MGGESARKNRGLRALAADRPREALALVGGFVEAGLEERLANLGEDDSEMAELIAMTPRKRAAAVRELAGAMGGQG